MGYFFKNSTDKTKIKPCDRKAPRGRCKRKNTFSKELFKKFKKQHPNIDIDFKTFKKIVYRGNEIFAQKICDEREGIALPERLGKIFIGSYDRGKDSPYYNWKILEEQNVAVSYKNWESDKYFCKIFYTSFGMNYAFDLKRYWYFSPCRILKQNVSKAFIKDWNKYIKVPRFQKLSKLDKEQNYETIKIVHHEPNNRRVDFTNTQPH